jgi:glycosyltransferase involved in cell wall biosynthesis
LQVIFENDNDRATFINHGLITLNNTNVIQGVGVDAEYYQPSAKPLNEVPLVVFPARMLYDKGLGTLINAARILKRKIRLRIALVGDLDPGNPSSVEEKTIKSWEKEGLVEWWGFNEDMLSVYQRSNIVVLPSFGEGLPTVLIEAAACARPIVATDVAGCRDVVIHNVNGLLVPVDHAESLAIALETLLRQPEMCVLMGEAGRKMVLEKFTDKIINNKTLLVYNQLLFSKQTNVN